MAKEHRLLQLATSLKPNQKVNMVAIVTKGGRVIAIGQNDMNKTHSCYFDQRKQFDKKIHAEFDALRKLRHRDLTSAKMYVFYFKKDGSLGNSKPCKYCQAKIREFGMGRVYYIEDGDWTYM